MRFTARELGFEAVSDNSLDAVSDRDFAIEFCAAASLTMMHLSRWSEELVLWSSQQFGFIDLPDRFCTGSSIMPQKKNPDVPELVRGKTGRVFGHLMGLLTLMKGQPLAYNKDNQEDKEPLFDAVDTLKDCLTAMLGMLPHVEVRADRMRRPLHRVSRPPPTSPIIWCARTSPSAMRTRSWDVASRTRSRAVYRCPS